jgi:hypothetical protein
MRWRTSASAAKILITLFMKFLVGFARTAQASPLLAPLGRTLRASCAFGGYVPGKAARLDRSSRYFHHLCSAAARADVVRELFWNHRNASINADETSPGLHRKRRPQPIGTRGSIA